MRVLVVEDGTQRSALAAVRGLGRAGHQVGVASPALSYFAGRSRFCSYADRCAPPASRAGLASLGEIASRRGYELVFGCSDEDLLALSGGRVSLPCPVAYPADDVVRALVDKDKISAIARSHDIAVPAYIAAGSLDGARFPVVVKGRATSGATRWETVVCADIVTARARVAEIEASSDAALIQESVRGDLLAVVLVLDRDGTVVGTAQQRAVHIWPQPAGISVRARTEVPDGYLVERCAATLRSIGWWGVAELQFLDDGSTPRLIDVNGRFYGSMALAIGAGVNLPDLCAQVALGSKPAPVVARPGVRYQWFEADLKRALGVRPGRLSSVAGTLRWALGAKHSIFDPSDREPAWAHLMRLVRRKKDGHGA